MDPNHRCRSERALADGNAVPAAAAAAAPVVDQNLSKNVDSQVRGRLSEVERMLREVKRDVMDKVKRETDEAKTAETTTTPLGKFLRFEDEDDDVRRGSRDLMRNTNNNSRNDGMEGPRFGPLARGGLGRGRGGGNGGNEGGTRRANSANNNIIYRKENDGRRCFETRGKMGKTPGRKEREMEEEFQRLDTIKSSVAELKRRHMNQSLTLKDTQEKLSRALEKLQDR